MSQTTEESQDNGVGEISLEPKEIFDLKPEEVLDRLLANAQQKNATDLFFLAKENHHDVSIRRMGSMEHLLSVPAEMGAHLVNYIRAQCGMDLVQKHSPVDGRWIYDSDRANYDLRINSIDCWQTLSRKMPLICFSWPKRTTMMCRSAVWDRHRRREGHRRRGNYSPEGVRKA